MQSETIDKLAEALAKAQGAMVNPTKNKKVTVTTKSGGRYEFEYADLTAIIDAIKKPLADNGIGYLQDIELVEGKWRLVTTLMHSSGQFRSSAWPLFLDQHDRDGNVIQPTSQSFGSALTFMKRYALAAIAGVAADSDDDANAADGAAQVQDRAPRQPKPPAPSQVKPPPPPPAKQATAPHELPAPQGDDWVGWSRNLLAEIKSAPQDDWTAWLSLNGLRIKALYAEAPKVFERLATALITAGVEKDIIEAFRK
jgi:hypothetical protein